MAKKEMSPPAAVTDDIDNLFEVLDKKKLPNALPEMFFGGRLTYMNAVRSTRGPEVKGRLDEIGGFFKTDPYCTKFIKRWEVLKSITSVLVSSPFDATAAIEAIKAILPKSPAERKLPDDFEQDYYQPVIDKIMPKKKEKVQLYEWTPAYWHLLTIIDAWNRDQPPAKSPDGKKPVREKDEESSPPQNIEQTPLLVATEGEGWVVNLKVERRPGAPGLITPDWWKLGLFPLGEKNELLNAIHKGFGVALEQYGGSKRIQLRWWLEQYPHTKALTFRSFGEATSVEVAAACVARALLEDHQDVPRPLLDSRVAVSGKLEELSGRKPKQAVTRNAMADDMANRTFEKRKVGVIGFHDRKIEAAQEAGLIAVLFSADSDKKLFTPETGTEKTGPLIQPVTTLDDAYESLLVTSKAIRMYKREIVLDWNGKDEHGNDVVDPKTGKFRGEWKEEKTPDDFKKDSQNDAEG